MLPSLLRLGVVISAGNQRVITGPRTHDLNKACCFYTVHFSIFKVPHLVLRLSGCSRM